MNGRGRLVCIALALATGLGDARAWAPETRVRMVDEATRLMPESLRLVLRNQREWLLRGMLEPLTGEDGIDHRPPWSGGRLDSRLADEAVALVSRLGRPESFSDVARQFGLLAHYVADAGFPPGVSRQNGDDRYGHFSAFCESRREKFPLVFYGHDDEQLAAGDFGAFARRLMEAASRDDRKLAQAYVKAGSPPDPAAFDDRSVPFALGSLTYSRTITNIVRAWLTVWQQAGGDMGRTPYWKLDPPEPDTAADPRRP